MEQIGVKPYLTSLEYLLDELRLIELHLGLAVIKFRKRNKMEEKGQKDFAGMYISNEEIDSVIHPTVEGDIDNERLYIAINAHKKIIEKRKMESTILSLKHVCEVFDLSEFEKNVLLICIAPEMDLKFEKLYSYLQNDITKKKPTIGLILDLLSNSIKEKVSNRQYFLNHNTLFRLHLINFE